LLRRNERLNYGVPFVITDFHFFSRSAALA
jgi:hypothetical protein